MGAYKSEIFKGSKSFRYVPTWSQSVCKNIFRSNEGVIGLTPAETVQLNRYINDKSGHG